MTIQEIIKKLKILGIDSSDQLEKNKLDFWWQKKYKEIKDSQLKEETIKEKLIEINEIYEDLSKVDEKLLFEIINKKSKEENIVDSDLDLYNQGLEHYKQNEYEKSIKKLSEAIDLNSDDPDYFNLRGWSYHRLKKYDKAIKDATKAIDLKSDEPEYFRLRGRAYFYLENYDNAIEDATKAINLEIDNPDHYELRADARRQFDLEESKEFIIDQYIVDNLEDIKKYLNEADRYYEKNRIIEAIDYYEKVLSKSSSEIKEILGNDAMIRINNRILEYRRMINS